MRTKLPSHYITGQPIISSCGYDITFCFLIVSGQPTILQINSATIRWDPGTNDICRRNVRYNVAVSRIDIDFNNTIINEITSNTSIDITNFELVSGQEYTAHVTTVLSSCTTDTAVMKFTFKDSSRKPQCNYWICRINVSEYMR